MNPGARKIKEWRKNVPLFVHECFGVSPDAWQIDALNLFGKNDQPKLRLSLQACVGPGKSALLSWCGWHFLICQGESANHPKGAAVSITGDNLADNLWPEFAKWQGINKESSYPIAAKAFTWKKERIHSNDHPETWFLSARSYSKSANAEEQGRTLSGLHGKYILVLFDESGEIPLAVGKTADQAMSERDCAFARQVQAGNPTSRNGMLYAAATTLKHLWEVIRITGDPEDPKRSPRIDIEFAREQIRTYGRDNPWVMSSILGEFPEGSMNTLLGPDDVEKSMSRYHAIDQYDFSQKRLGVDVARFGCFDDQTEILTDEGWKYFEDLHGKERVLTLNGEISEWGVIEEVHRYPFVGYLNSQANSKINFAVTDNHKFLVRSAQKSNKYVLKKYEDLPETYMIRGTNGWSGKSPERISFCTTKNMFHGGVQLHKHDFCMIDWASFLGWFVSEGNVYCAPSRPRSRRIILTQNPGIKRTQIENLLSKMGIKWRHCANGMQIEFNSISIGNHLIEECKQGASNKRVPKYIKEGSEEVILAFLESFNLGDGTRRRDGYGRVYMTSSRLLADDLQEMLAKVGRAGKLSIKNTAGSVFTICGRTEVRRFDTYIVYERTSVARNPSRQRDKFVIKSKANKVPYSGDVWCISTPLKTIYVRRQGVPMWSGNSDSTVLFPRQGLMAFRPVVMRNARTHDIAARIMQAKSKWGSEMEMIDDTGGFGSGVIDQLLQAGTSPIAVHFSEKANDARYLNKRAEMWFLMAEWVKRGGALPKDSGLARELTTPLYFFQNGKFQLESKDQIKRRLQFSPDKADALALTFAYADMPRSGTLEAIRADNHNKMLAEYDPFKHDDRD